MEGTRRVALIHDFLLDLRGAERVFLQLAAMFPAADIFTTVYDRRGTGGRFSDRRVRTSFLQRLHPSARNFRVLAPLFPAAVESLDLTGYDLVISSSSAWAHAVLCDPAAVHVCYCHNPFRYAWNAREHTVARAPDPFSRALLYLWLRQWRQWDWVAAQRPQRYLANSRITQSRIRAYFGRDSVLLHPPVDLERFHPGRVGEHYTVVSALMSHKRIEPVVEAFNRLGRPLVVVGEGPARRSLRRLARPNVTFTGRSSDEEVAELLRSSRAVILPAVEEFGLVSVEAQASGRPVLARRGGGALETVVEGETGAFFSGDAEEIAAAVAAFDDAAIDPARCVASARRFSPENFRRGMRSEIAAATALAAEQRKLPAAGRPASPRRRAAHNWSGARAF